jgi:hypothetical protein
VHKIEGLELPQIQSYNDVHTYAPIILGQLYFFRNQVLTLYWSSDITVRF